MVFRRVGLGIVKIWNFDLVNAVENHRWSCKFGKLALCDLVHFLQLADVSHKVNDASDKQLGAVISHNNKPISLFSRRLSNPQRNYTTTKKELLAIV